MCASFENEPPGHIVYRGGSEVVEELPIVVTVTQNSIRVASTHAAIFTPLFVMSPPMHSHVPEQR